jgi:hypothetical protein
MALDPSIALGIKPIEVQNPVNQYAQMQQIQHYQQQNALANRAIEQEDALNRAYASSMDPATGKIDANKLRQNVAGANLGSKLPAVEKSLMETRKLGGEVDKIEFENKKNKYERSISDIINFDTHDQILGSLKSKVDTGELDLATAERLAASVPQDPRMIPAWQVKTARGLLSAKDKLEQQFTSQDFGGGARVIATPKFGGGPAQVVQGSQIAKTMAPGESERIELERKRVKLAENEAQLKREGIEGIAPKELQKREAALPAATQSIKGFEAKSDSFIRDLEALRDHPGLEGITGAVYGRTPSVGKDSSAAQALYDKVVAKGGFQALQDLRDASKTGGALGNVSNQEGKQLSASFAAIQRTQSADDVKAAINQAIADIEGAKTRTREAYDSTYSYKRPAAAAGGGVDTSNPLLKP